MAVDIVEFLNELPESESVLAIQHAFSKKALLVFKVETYPNPIKAQIDLILDKKAFLNKELFDLKADLEKEVSIKFNLGTDVYFIKTNLKKTQNKYYFDMNSKVIQLKRRKESRHLVPKKWTQSSSIMGDIKSLHMIKCNVIDISFSGIRLEIIDKGNFLFLRNDLVKIQFQIYKRAEITVEAIVRFFMNRNEATSLLGLEFMNLNDAQKDKVKSIIEDIILFQSSKKI